MIFFLIFKAGEGGGGGRGRGGGGGAGGCVFVGKFQIRISESKKRILRFWGANRKTDHESRLRADSSDQIQIRIFEIHNLSVFLEQDLKKVFLTSGFTKKEMVRERSRTLVYDIPTEPMLVVLYF